MDNKLKQILSEGSDIRSDRMRAKAIELGLSPKVAGNLAAFAKGAYCAGARDAFRFLKVQEAIKGIPL